jgi:hypothetical protein
MPIWVCAQASRSPWQQRDGPDQARELLREGLRLIPLETHDRGRYRSHAHGVRPPWHKRAYHEPESDES